MPGPGIPRDLFSGENVRKKTSEAGGRLLVKDALEKQRGPSNGDKLLNCEGAERVWGAEACEYHIGARCPGLLARGGGGGRDKNHCSTRGGGRSPFGTEPRNKSQ